MSRRYPTNDQILSYPCLPLPSFNETMIAGAVSNYGNNNAQVYGIFFGWASFPPMKLKSDAHETFPLLFKRDGAPPEIIMDNSKEQLIIYFCKKLREANFH